jgi:hypothetical protein
VWGSSATVAESPAQGGFGARVLHSPQEKHLYVEHKHADTTKARGSTLEAWRQRLAQARRTAAAARSPARRHGRTRARRREPMAPAVSSGACGPPRRFLDSRDAVTGGTARVWRRRCRSSSARV